MKNPFIRTCLTIWTQPRTTLRFILETAPKKWLIPFSLLNGITYGLFVSGKFWIPAKENSLATHFGGLLGLLLASALLGVFHLYFSTWLYQLTGKWLKGKGSYTDVKCAVGWSSYLFMIVNSIGIIATLSLKVFGLHLAFSILFLLLFLWAFFLFFKLLGEAHRFSAWRAIGCFFVACVLLFAVVMLVILLIPLIQPLFANM